MFTEELEYVGNGLKLSHVHLGGNEMLVSPGMLEGFHRLMAIKDPTANHE